MGERLIQQYVLEGYTPINMFFPSGICVRCIHLLHQVKEGREVELKLPASYDCELPRHTRASEGEVCTCRWCDLARLNGPAFFLWQRKVKWLEVRKVRRLCQNCYVGILEGFSHTLDAVRNLTESLPQSIQDKMALEILKQRQVELNPTDKSLPISCHLPVEDFLFLTWWVRRLLLWHLSPSLAI